MDLKCGYCGEVFSENALLTFPVPCEVCGEHACDQCPVCFGLYTEAYAEGKDNKPFVQVE